MTSIYSLSKSIDSFNNKTIKWFSQTNNQVKTNWKGFLEKIIRKGIWSIVFIPGEGKTIDTSSLSSLMDFKSNVFHFRKTIDGFNLF